MDNQLEKITRATFKIEAEVTSTSMSFPSDITIEQLKGIGQTFVNMESSKQWWVGDWWNAIERKHGEAQKICDEIGLDYSSVRRMGAVSRRIENARRRASLSFSHHGEVCIIKLEDKEREVLIQDNFLEKAEQEKWSHKELRKQVQFFLDEEKWTVGEKQRRQVVIDGGTIVANIKTDGNIIQWAEMNDYLIKIDRSSDWGNPFILPIDGDRDTVCDNYATYLGMKPSLLNRLNELRGKVLACWCYPERCHGEELIRKLT